MEALSSPHLENCILQRSKQIELSCVLPRLRKASTSCSAETVSALEPLWLTGVDRTRLPSNAHLAKPALFALFLGLGNLLLSLHLTTQSFRCCIYTAKAMRHITNLHPVPFSLVACCSSDRFFIPLKLANLPPSSQALLLHFDNTAGKSWKMRFTHACIDKLFKRKLRHL